MPKEKRTYFEQLTDEALMLRYVDGDNTAFEHLFRRHRNKKGYAIQRVGNPHTAEDLVQKAWLNILKSKERYQPTAKFNTYLTKVLERVIIDYYRSEGKKKERTSHEENRIVDEKSGHKFMNVDNKFHKDPDPQPDTAKGSPRSVESRVLVGECLRYLEQCIGALPREQNQCFLLKLHGGLTLQEIAEEIKEKQETVKSRIRYAMDKLRQCMPQECEEYLQESDSGVVA